MTLKEKTAVYPYVFPIRNVARPPKDLAIRAGYYCIDTFTPLSHNAYRAARRAVDCGLTAAQLLLQAYPIAYALVRPPGHHAERRAFGGFCYFNTAAIAAQYLRASGPVAIVDIDYHHGNGQQDIFWQRGDVLTISIHGHPSFAYPYFSGFEDEHGTGDGTGRNVNIALPEEVDGERYRRALKPALRTVQEFAPDYLVVALGLDPAKGDPTGSWTLSAADFEENGKLIGALGLPTLVVQEGGYRTASLGVNARRFLLGLWKGKYRETGE
ncbi:MAG: histone deacetylase family protein, partial [Longimicrobiales bacterium]